MTTPEGWWQNFFDDDYAAYGLAAYDPEITAETIDFLVERLDLKPGTRVFDQCCGIGRLSLPLARRGIEVVGVDIAETYVTRARAEASQEELPCTFHHGDAYEFVTPEPCDAAFCWFSSFGYSEDDAVNGRQLQRAFDSIRPGGRFAMELYNTLRVIAHFTRTFMDRRDIPGVGEVLAVQEAEIDAKRGMIDNRWTFIYPDGRRDERQFATRLILPHELVALLENAGFTDVDLLGGRDGSPFTPDSKRLIILAKRPT